MIRFTLEQIRLITYAFAIGDALGSVFEFKSVPDDEIRDRFYSDDRISFTDDTKLLLISNKVLFSALRRYEVGNLREFDRVLLTSACHELSEWWSSGDLRGVGYATQEAIRQIRRHHSRHHSYDGFSIDQTQYDYDKSAGNGILSRVLPFILKGFSPRTGWVNEFLRLTHLHIDGHRSAEALFEYIQQEEVSSIAFTELRRENDLRGFYAPETLFLSIQAGVCSDLFQVFSKSCVPGGDSDSIAALSFAIRFINTIRTSGSELPRLDLSRLIGRMTQDDREEIESSLM